MKVGLRRGCFAAELRAQDESPCRDSKHHVSADAAEGVGRHLNRPFRSRLRDCFLRSARLPSRPQTWPPQAPSNSSPATKTEGPRTRASRTELPGTQPGCGAPAPRFRLRRSFRDQQDSQHQHAQIVHQKVVADHGRDRQTQRKTEHELAPSCRLDSPPMRRQRHERDRKRDDRLDGGHRVACVSQALRGGQRRRVPELPRAGTTQHTLQVTAGVQQQSLGQVARQPIATGNSSCRRLVRRAFLAGIRPGRDFRAGLRRARDAFRAPLQAPRASWSSPICRFACTATTGTPNCERKRSMSMATPRDCATSIMFMQLLANPTQVPG